MTISKPDYDRGVSTAPAGEQRKGSRWWLGLVALLPLACCGLPLLVAAGAAAGAGALLGGIGGVLLLVATVEALRMAARQKLDGSRHGDKASDLALVMAGGLHVLRDRLHLVARILTSAVNASEILCDENEAGLIEEGPGIVREWSVEEQAERLEAEWRLACSRRLSEQPRAIFGFTRNKKPYDRSN